MSPLGNPCAAPVVPLGVATQPPQLALHHRKVDPSQRRREQARHWIALESTDQLDNGSAALLAGQHQVGHADVAEQRGEAMRSQGDVTVGLEVSEAEHRHEHLSTHEVVRASGQRGRTRATRVEGWVVERIDCVGRDAQRAQPPNHHRHGRRD